MERLDRRLSEYSKKDYYAFHMPGHKRHMKVADFSNPFLMDITEIEGFDNLHHPESILKEAQERIADLYGAKQSFYSVNGSTAGILSGISACTKRGGTLLMARNCHKAVYHAAYLRGLRTNYLYPAYEAVYGLNGGINPQDVRTALEEDPAIEAVILTSPTYDGVVSDIKTISGIVHEFQIPLIVDEAHGAHFGFHDYFPASALALGADLVIHSLHKTMPSLTQTAVVHRNSDRVPLEVLKRFLGIYQTSSPSYVLMGSMDACTGLINEKGRVLFDQYAFRLQRCRERMRRLGGIRLVPLELEGSNYIYRMDPSKLVLSVERINLTGTEFYSILLEKYHLQMEMKTENYVLAMTSVMDTEEGYERLCTALEEIDKRYMPLFPTEREKFLNTADKESIDTITETIQVKTIAQAVETEQIISSLWESEGKISSEYCYLYPPGIPMLVPGERITRIILEQLKRCSQQGLDIQGMSDYSLKTIRIMKE